MPTEIEVHYGDLWQLDNHKILCYDSGKEEAYKHLFGLERWDMILTDPPYGVNYSSKNKFLNKYDKGNRIEEGIIQDGEIPNFLLKKMLAYSRRYAQEYNTIYIFISDKEIPRLINLLEKQGYTFSQILVWNKNNIVLGRTDYYLKHEFIIYGWYQKHRFWGDKKYPTVLNFDKNMQNHLHPTQKPVNILKLLIKNGSPSESLIFDPFGGSGSTLMAVEYLNRQNSLFGNKTQRKAYVIEILPKYVEITIKRYLKAFKNAQIKYIKNIERS